MQKKPIQSITTNNSQSHKIPQSFRIQKTSHHLIGRLLFAFSLVIKTYFPRPINNQRFSHIYRSPCTLFVLHFLFPIINIVFISICAAFKKTTNQKRRNRNEWKIIVDFVSKRKEKEDNEIFPRFFMYLFQYKKIPIVSCTLTLLPSSFISTLTLCIAVNEGRSVIHEGRSMVLNIWR